MRLAPQVGRQPQQVADADPGREVGGRRARAVAGGAGEAEVLDFGEVVLFPRGQLDGRAADLAFVRAAQFGQQPLEFSFRSRCVDDLDRARVAETVLRVGVGGQPAQDADRGRLDDRVGAGVHPHSQYRVRLEVGQVVARFLKGVALGGLPVRAEHPEQLLGKESEGAHWPMPSLVYLAYQPRPDGAPAPSLSPNK